MPLGPIHLNVLIWVIFFTLSGIQAKVLLISYFCLTCYHYIVCHPVMFVILSHGIENLTYSNPIDFHIREGLYLQATISIRDGQIGLILSRHCICHLTVLISASIEKKFHFVCYNLLASSGMISP